MLSGILKSPHTYIVAIWTGVLLFYGLSRSSQSEPLHLIPSVVKAVEQAPVVEESIVKSPKRVIAKNSALGKQGLDLNRLGTSGLQKIDGIGPVIAGRIVAYRELHGPFQTIDEVVAIKGIGPAKLKKIKAQCLVK